MALLIPQVLGESAGLQRILHFAPETVLRGVLSVLPGVEYRTTDLFDKGVDYPGENLEALGFPNRSFDVVLCNHVLEHVANDELAMVEMARILTPGGLAVITIPGDWSRAKTIMFPDTTLNGHYRDYGLDVTHRLQQHFGAVRVFDLHTLDRVPGGLSYGIRPNDVAFLCSRPVADKAGQLSQRC